LNVNDLVLNVFVRDRPTIDWIHGGSDARWAAFDNSGEPLALTLGTRAPNGALVSGPLFGGTVSIGGVWYQGGSFPAAFSNVYYHADSGCEWIKAFTFDATAPNFFGLNGGAIPDTAFTDNGGGSPTSFGLRVIFRASKYESRRSRNTS